jgi:DNA polymerase-3 subunit beta
VRTGDLVEAVKRVALVAERNTPVRLRFSEGQVAIEAGTGDDAQASEAVEATLTGPRSRSPSTPLPARRARCGRHPVHPHLVHPGLSRPAVLTGQAEEDGEADTSYRYVLMPVRFAS